MGGTPLQERVVKTVGRTPTTAQTPGPAPSFYAAATPGPAPTPSAKAVKQIASVPLPDDTVSGGETEPFASSDDEQAGPASPGAVPPPVQRASARTAAPRAAKRGSRALFGVLTLTSIFATLVVALVLTPCAVPELYAVRNPAVYTPVCKGLNTVYGRAAEAAWRVRSEAAHRASALYSELPPAGRELLEKSWEPLQQAHAAALVLLDKAAVQLEERVAPLRPRASELVRELYAHVGPTLDSALTYILQASRIGSTASPVASAPPVAMAAARIEAINQTDFVSLLDPEQQHLAQDLWAAGERQIATKRKAVAWLLVCTSSQDCRRAEGRLFGGATSVVHIDGGAYSEEDSAGTLQLELGNFLKQSPGGLVMVTQLARLHPKSVSVLNAALSESGHLQMDGVPVATERALYVFVADFTGQGVVDEQAVKQWLTDVLASKGDDAVAAIARSFRRRLDAVFTPVQETEVKPGVYEGYWHWRGHRIRYQRSGDEGVPVLLVHGFGGNADHWRKNTPVLGARHRAFAIDLLGYGYSDKPNPRTAPPNTIYSFDNWGQQLCDFIEERIGSDPTFIICNSVGGLAGLQASITAPQLVAGVQCIDISLRGLHVKRQAPWQRPFVAAFQRFLKETDAGKAFFANVATERTVGNILRQAYGRKEAVTEELVSAILRPGLQPGAVDVFLDFISYSGGPLPEDLMAATTRPVSLLWGEADPWEDAREGRRLFANLPSVVEFVTLPGVGHCPQDEAPELVNPLIERFVQQYAERGGAAGAQVSAVPAAGSASA
ncbi:hypothetical protein GPECTOR_75g750 [Gonium pectorale]|uniref:AB hydrolase-1 domain-containing protein n=1 Tax=Gonium pectorale TaxID=33097 RepID=A0A150G2C9_GONPE|nr:hypothetical protein GPECTOR_75g750 [Gonium pectorale]|eukprot:KXZ44026.1 hypothetical protein GPECTOR_75g750 [Gonium pectorale]